jgi:hypothetical protein
VETVFKPGDKVPATAIYMVCHDEHRLMHHATLTAGMQFPLCRKCQSRVRFSLVRAVKRELIPFRASYLLMEYPTTHSSKKDTMSAVS